MNDLAEILFNIAKIFFAISSILLLFILTVFLGASAFKVAELAFLGG